jgi:hypothetical protein
MKLIRRYKESRVEESDLYFLKSIKANKGIRPENCPAIRKFFSLGVLIFSPIEFLIINKFRFEVIVRSNSQGNKLLIPGIIGAPGSPKFYARIDTGFSFDKLETPVIAIKCQNHNAELANLEIPPTYYPLGYTGPILAPISASKPTMITKNHPLLQLIELDSSGRKFDMLDQKITHPTFEGLLYDNYIDDYEIKTSTYSDDLVPTK